MRFNFSIEQVFPAISWMRTLRPAHVRADLSAGLTNAAMVLPQGVAFAAIAGLPPEYGLYTAMVPTILAALFGSSMIMVSGPATAISAVVLSTLSGVHEIGSPDYIAAAMMLALMVGVFQLLLGIMQAGKLASFVSHSVMLGFTLAAAVLIFVSQIKDVIGVEIERGGSVFERIARLIEVGDQADWQSLSIAAVTFAVAFGLGQVTKRLPVFLIALVAGSVLANLMQANVRMVGEIDAILPTPIIPWSGSHDLIALTEGAFVLAVIGLLEALAIGRSFAPQSGHKFVANQEVIGQGLSNFIGAFFQAYPSSGSFTRTGVNHAAGGQTPLAAVFAALFLIAIMALVAPLIPFVPIPAMAGLIVLVAIRLINFKEIRHIRTRSRTEALILAVTFLTGILIKLELALLFGVLLSFGTFVYRTARPVMQIEAPDTMLPGRIFRDAEEFGLPECPQLMITRFDGPMYFGSAEYLEAEFERLRLERPDQKHIIVNLKGTGDIDLAGVDALISEHELRGKMGGGLYVIARSIRLMARLEQLGLIRRIHGNHMFENKHEAIGLLVPRLDLSICANCPMPIFGECARNKTRAEMNAQQKKGA